MRKRERGLKIYDFGVFLLKIAVSCTIVAKTAIAARAWAAAAASAAISTLLTFILIGGKVRVS